jgi:A/G-specific adenine glycosylase
MRSKALHGSPSQPREPQLAELARLLPWYRQVRRDLPWRRTRDPYAIWVSETMLQQTRVETVLPYYERFLRELPDVFSLAEAQEEQVLALWSGLGYYRRARMLHAAAKTVAGTHGGRLPEDPADLQRLEGVGAYTAGAVASIAFGRRAALVDGNVARVVARLFAIQEDVKGTAGAARVWAIAGRLVAEVDGPPGDWNQALMELGATVCTPREPRCGECPVAAGCAGRALGIAGELPRTSAKRKPVALRRVALVIASPAGVLLARRRKEVLFGGLWEPPSADGVDPGPLAERLGVAVAELRAGGRVVHLLSHRRMDVRVSVASMGRRRRWPLPGPDYDAVEVVRVDELPTRAHSTLAKKVLAAAGALPLAKGPAAGLRSQSK